MDLRFKNRRAMVTVELAVSLVLIVVALFVTLGLFNNNLRDMVSNSNFKNLFNGNGSRTFFSFFNKDYKNAQVYVQIMGEQGLQILRKKANNGVVSAVESLSPSGGSVQNTGAYDTISYLSQIITVIMGNQIICDTMTIPSTAECNAPGMPGAKYNVTFTGTSLIINPVGERTASRGITVTTTGTVASMAAAKNAFGYDTKDKFNFISELSSDESTSGMALVKTIGYFSSVISKGGSFATNDNVDAKIVSLLNQITSNMTAANGACIGHTWIGNLPYQKTWVDGCSSDADVVNDGDLSAYKSHLAVLSESINEYATQANCIAYPQTKGCTPAAASLAKLPMNSSELPIYSANGNPTSLPDTVALASYKNIGAITAGISDAFVMANPLSDTSNMIAMYACVAPSVDQATGGNPTCGAGQHLAATDCCMPNGIDANGNPITTATTTCATGSYFDTTSSTCKVCPYELPSNGSVCTCPTGSRFFVPTDGTDASCVCPVGFTFDSTTMTCSGSTTNLATIADNICKTGIATHCDALIVQVPAVNSKGSPITIDLQTSYIASPLNDSLLSAVKTTKTTYLQDRINILKLYNKMLDAIWSGKVTILNDISEDNYNNPKSCPFLISGLTTIAKDVGIISMMNDIQANKTKCTPGVK